ncbi:YcgN family cysteine cluster protein [Halioxenophilus sp. WMMB6]|uniref:YcgN family cysteine cluster protein n=1 Tax=Halioxenophilus sp. WMMB6 TaxID=3073815 RepID=UPI00295F050C|nr:YcgN family cysteine cluster protein [Halioxenophilus sp. WMMB6]
MAGDSWQALRASQYWLHKPLAEMSKPEWEALCDGCGKCCLHKLIDDETDELYYTDIACRLLDTDQVRCGDYHNRHQQIPDCLEFTPDNLPELYWLPASCAYRTLGEGRQLQRWHPLISGDPASVHQFKRSVQGRCVSETEVPLEQFEERIVRWV